MAAMAEYLFLGQICKQEFCNFAYLLEILRASHANHVVFFFIINIKQTVYNDLLRYKEYWNIGREKNKTKHGAKTIKDKHVTVRQMVKIVQDFKQKENRDIGS